MTEDEKRASILRNATGEDFGFDSGTDEEFDAAAEAFRNSDFRREQSEPDEDIIDAEILSESGGNGREDAPDALELYAREIERWERGSEFVNDADKVDTVRRLRLEMAENIADDPTLIASPRLAQMKKSDGSRFKGDLRDYLKADIAYNERPDPASTRYADFARERARLRDALFGDDAMVSAEAYATFTRRTQSAILGADKIDDQYDLIDLRREAALEHYDNPRFIAEIANASPSRDSNEKDGLLDEILVDFDRRDLLVEQMDPATRARSEAMADVFSESVRKVSEAEGFDSQTSTEKVANFQNMREAGRSVRHNQRAIALFARGHQGDHQRIGYELGLAALDDTTISRGLYDRWLAGLTPEETKEIRKKESVTAVFGLARKKFESEYDAGNPRAAESFAVLEQAGGQILADPKLERRLSAEGGLEDIAALHLFSPRYQEKTLSKKPEQFEDKVLEKMGDKAILEGARSGSADLKSKDGEAYNLDLDEAGKNAQVSVVDGAYLMVSNSKEDASEGKGVILRLDGIVAPPPGTQTKSDRYDAGLAAKGNLEEVINRHGIDSVGMQLETLETGETVLKAKLASGEDLSERQLISGFAMPTKDSPGSDRREHMTKQAESARRGLWSEGFAEMDESWRRENAGPRMTWQDKKLRVTETVGKAMAATHKDAYRRLSRSETKLFALPLRKWSANPRIDDEIGQIVKKNPSRVMGIYENNMEILKDMRKRKDKLSQAEKVAHDRLTMGNRALASSLTSRNILDEKQAQKNDHPFMSGQGMDLSLKGVRPMMEAATRAAEVGAKTAHRGLGAAGRGLNSIVDLAAGD